MRSTTEFMAQHIFDDNESFENKDQAINNQNDNDGTKECVRKT